MQFRSKAAREVYERREQQKRRENSGQVEENGHVPMPSPFQSFPVGSLRKRTRSESKQVAQDQEEQTIQKNGYKTPEDFYLKELDQEIGNLGAANADEPIELSNFRAALRDLREDLRSDISKQLIKTRTQIDQEEAKAEIFHSPAVRIANKTTTMLKRLAEVEASDEEPKDKETRKRIALTRHNQECTKLSPCKQILQTLGKVFISGLCIFGCAVAGAGIGALTGPQGIGIGTVAGTIVGSTAALVINRWLLFQPNKTAQCVNAVSEKGKTYVRSQKRS